MARIGIIGGSGLYQMEGLTAVEKIKLSTPFGEPSGDYLLGELEGREVVFYRGMAGGIISCRLKSIIAPTSMA